MLGEYQLMRSQTPPKNHAHSVCLISAWGQPCCYQALRWSVQAVLHVCMYVGLFAHCQASSDSTSSVTFTYVCTYPWLKLLSFPRLPDIFNTPVFLCPNYQGESWPTLTTWLGLKYYKRMSLCAYNIIALCPNNIPWVPGHYWARCTHTDLHVVCIMMI